MRAAISDFYLGLIWVGRTRPASHAVNSWRGENSPFHLADTNPRSLLLFPIHSVCSNLTSGVAGDGGQEGKEVAVGK